LLNIAKSRKEKFSKHLQPRNQKKGIKAMFAKHSQEQEKKSLVNISSAEKSI